MRRKDFLGIGIGAGEAAGAIAKAHAIDAVVGEYDIEISVVVYEAEGDTGRVVEVRADVAA